jgi:hypothetical protein
MLWGALPMLWSAPPKLRGIPPKFWRRDVARYVSTNKTAANVTVFFGLSNKTITNDELRSKANSSFVIRHSSLFSPYINGFSPCISYYIPVPASQNHLFANHRLMLFVCTG